MLLIKYFLALPIGYINFYFCRCSVPSVCLVSLCSQYYLNTHKTLSIQEQSVRPLQAVSDSSHVGTSRQGLLRLLPEVKNTVIVL
jgi:hypothetical protein